MTMNNDTAGKVKELHSDPTLIGRGGDRIEVLTLFKPVPASSRFHNLHVIDVSMERVGVGQHHSPFDQLVQLEGPNGRRWVPRHLVDRNSLGTIDEVIIHRHGPNFFDVCTRCSQVGMIVWPSRLPK